MMSMSCIIFQVSFPNLEKLILDDLPKLRAIWHHQHPPESFYNLQILEVYNCPGLLNLIPSHLIQRFGNLKEIKVDDCEVLKHVFDLQGLDENIRILPGLESLRLNSLPKLRRVVCNEDDDKNDSVRCLFSSSTAFHNLKFLSIANCGNKVEDEGHINTPMEDVVLFDGKVSFLPYFFHFLILFREMLKKDIPLKYKKNYENIILIFNNRFIKLI